MEPKFKWTILGVKCTPEINGQFDVIHSAQWGCYAEELNETGDAYRIADLSGWVDFSYSPDAHFTPRHQVDENTILSWCFAGGVDKQLIEQEAQAVLDGQRTE